MAKRRALLLVHGVYHGAWCFEEHWAPRLRARGHRVHALDLPIGAHAFSLEACIEAVAQAWSSAPEPPVVVGHSLGGRLVRFAMGRVPIDHGILLAVPDDRQLVWAAMQLTARRPRTMLRAILGGRHEHAYHDAELADAMFFAGTLEDHERDRLLGRVREVSYPRHALAAVLAMGRPPRPLHPHARIDVVIGSRDLACRGTRARSGESLHVLRGAPHDVMLGPTADAALGLIEQLLRSEPLPQAHS